MLAIEVMAWRAQLPAVRCLIERRAASSPSQSIANSIAIAQLGIVLADQPGSAALSR